MLRLKVKTGGQIILVPAEDILPPENYVRLYLSEAEIVTLAESLKRSGMLKPITVRSAEEGKYIVVSGERRRQAAIYAGFDYIPCVVVQADEIQSIIYDLTGNLHSKELHFLELAQAIDCLHGIFSLNELSSMLSIPEGTVLSKIKLLSLPENIKWKIITAGLSETAASSLCALTDAEKMNCIADIMIKTGMSFSQAQQTAEKASPGCVFVARYKDLTVFRNTIEHAVDTMNASGINAQISKNETDTNIFYTISIDKMV